MRPWFVLAYLGGGLLLGCTPVAVGSLDASSLESPARSGGSSAREIPSRLAEARLLPGGDLVAFTTQGVVKLRAEAFDIERAAFKRVRIRFSDLPDSGGYVVSPSAARPANAQGVLFLTRSDAFGPTTYYEIVSQGNAGAVFYTTPTFVADIAGSLEMVLANATASATTMGTDSISVTFPASATGSVDAYAPAGAVLYTSVSTSGTSLYSRSKESVAYISDSYSYGNVILPATASIRISVTDTEGRAVKGLDRDYFSFDVKRDAGSYDATKLSLDRVEETSPGVYTLLATYDLPDNATHSYSIRLGVHDKPLVFDSQP